MCAYTHSMEAFEEFGNETSRCLCFTLRRAARAVTQFYDWALRPHGLRATQLPILGAASQREAIPLASLAKRLGMDRTTLIRNVRPLVRRKLVELATDESRRTEIRITEAGRELLAQAYPSWKRAQTQMLRRLEGTEWTQTLDALAEAARRTPD